MRAINIIHRTCLVLCLFFTMVTSGFGEDFSGLQQASEFYDLITSHGGQSMNKLASNRKFTDHVREYFGSYKFDNLEGISLGIRDGKSPLAYKAILLTLQGPSELIVDTGSYVYGSASAARAAFVRGMFVYDKVSGSIGFMVIQGTSSGNEYLVRILKKNEMGGDLDKEMRKIAVTWINNYRKKYPDAVLDIERPVYIR